MAVEAKAVAKYIRVQPRKVRIVAAEVKGKSAVAVANTLQFHPSKSAFQLRKVVISAIANAENNLGIPGNTLKIARILVDEGPKLKRVTQKAMGRGARIVKKTSHITVVLTEQEAAKEIKPHGTKAKARPKFEAPKKAKAAKKEEVVAEATEAPAEEAVEEVTEAPAAEATEAPAETAEKTEETN